MAPEYARERIRRRPRLVPFHGPIRHDRRAERERVRPNAPVVECPGNASRQQGCPLRYRRRPQGTGEHAVRGREPRRRRGHFGVGDAEECRLGRVALCGAGPDHGRGRGELLRPTRLPRRPRLSLLLQDRMARIQRRGLRPRRGYVDAPSPGGVRQTPGPDSRLNAPRRRRNHARRLSGADQFHDQQGQVVGRGLGSAEGRLAGRDVFDDARGRKVSVGRETARQPLLAEHFANFIPGFRYAVRVQAEFVPGRKATSRSRYSSSARMPSRKPEPERTRTVPVAASYSKGGGCPAVA